MKHAMESIGISNFGQFKHYQRTPDGEEPVCIVHQLIEQILACIKVGLTCLNRVFGISSNFLYIPFAYPNIFSLDLEFCKK